MKKRRVLVILESRATYGYSKNVMNVLQDYSDIEMLTLVTGMHLVAELGNSIDLIRNDGFTIDATVPLHGNDLTKGAWSKALGQGIEGFARAFEELQPDIVLLSGDRIETFGCCIAAAYMGIPMAHIQAGDKSGHIDDSARNAIGKFSHIHLASCEDSVNRLVKMGEQDFRIFNVGAPQLDNIIGNNYETGLVEINSRKINLQTPFILVVQHSVLVEEKDVNKQMKSTLEACVKFNMLIVIIFPNSDLGYKKIINEINEYRSNDNLIILSNIEREVYLRLLANCSVLVGNSSSGILEAPSFKIPVVNIGNRQRGRQQASNILNSSHLVEDIIFNIDCALNNKVFEKEVNAAINPYGDGKSSKRICEILSNIDIDRKLLDKESSY